MAHTYRHRAYRDGFHGREPASACPVYMDAYAHGLRDGDRTQARLVAGPTATASAVSLAPAADVDGDASTGGGVHSHV